MLIQAEHNDFKVTVQVTGYNDDELEMLESATTLMARAIGDPMFKEYCLNYSYEITKYKWTWSGKKTWKETYKGFYGTEGLSQFQVYEKIIKGQELLSGDGEDNEADIYLGIDRSDKPGVLGYSYSSSIWQYIYSRVFREYGVNTVAGNLCHEWCHKMDFHHYSSSTPSTRKKHTTPYAVGYYVKYYLDFQEALVNSVSRPIQYN